MNQLQIINEKEAAHLLSVGVQTLRNWRHLRKGPPYIKISSRSVRYRISDLGSFMEARKIHPEG